LSAVVLQLRVRKRENARDIIIQQKRHVRRSHSEGGYDTVGKNLPSQSFPLGTEKMTHDDFVVEVARCDLSEVGTEGINMDLNTTDHISHNSTTYLSKLYRLKVGKPQKPYDHNYKKHYDAK